MSWNYRQPVNIIFGNGKIYELKDLLSEYKNPLLVSDPFFATNGLIEKVKSIAGIKYVFTNISPNPDVIQVNECSKLILEKDIDVLVAVGGGSVMDLAKAASIAAENIEDYFNGKQIIPVKRLPIIAVPTTAGTGSEVTCVSVLTDRKIGKKSPIVSELFYPETAIVDPKLLSSMPLRLQHLQALMYFVTQLKGIGVKVISPFAMPLQFTQ